MGLLDWKWRKYNVTICTWISNEYKLYLQEGNDTKNVSFDECQQKFEKDHKHKKSTRSQPIIEENDDESDGKDDEKTSELKRSESKKRGKKIAIDAFFDVNSNYKHCLVFERQHIWHQIKAKDGREYLREIKLEHQLFGVRKEMKVEKYETNPSPFVTPNLLAVDVQVGVYTLAVPSPL